MAANYRRRAANVREEATAHPEPPPDTADPSAAIDQERMLDRLHEALEGLSEAKRDVFVLFELQELSMAEVADIVGCPVQTAYARLYAARRELKEQLRRGTI